MNNWYLDRHIKITLNVLNCLKKIKHICISAILDTRISQVLEDFLEVFLVEYKMNFIQPSS